MSVDMKDYLAYQEGYEAGKRDAASPWHRVEEPPKEHGPFLCASKSEHNGQTHWFFELCWYADGDLKDVVFDAEQDSGFYSWSASQDRDIDSRVDYWMPIEPPKEEKQMTFNRGGFVISVDKIDGFGKMPGLYVGRKNKLFKVASFGNDKKAEAFCQYLEFIAGITNEPPKEEEHGN